MLKVEVGQYRKVNKDGVFKATFSVVIYPHAQKVLDCKYFVSGDKDWFAFPQFKVKSKDGSKEEYIPYISYGDKDYLAELRESILTEVRKHTNQTAVEIDCPF